MKKRTVMLLSAVLCTLGVESQEDWAGFRRYEKANVTAAKGAKAVFMGNSITEGWANSRPEFFIENGYIGRGISGQVTSQMLARFRADVLDLGPKCVVILAGTNDIAMNKGFISIRNIAGNIFSMAELARAHGIRTIICSTLPVYDYPWRKGLEPADKIIELNALLRDYAARNGCLYVDYHSAMKDERNGLPEKYAKDGVHPTAEGYAVMEAIIKPEIDRAAKAKKR
ncbi:MAG: SGNH/GDSL hydrolase family protein [Rikenellaceae bacterium]|jgi:lysophospholipase L1-like esterase|nr:SGNH/GDSL hydrolase family protein [Rikenellaceae bacterium]